MVEVVGQLWDATLLLPGVIAQSIVSIDHESAIGDADDVSDIFRDAYLLSRSFQYQHISLLIAKTCLQMRGNPHQGLDSASAHSCRARADELIGECEKLRARGQAVDENEQSLESFDPEVLEILVRWESCARVIRRDIHVTTNISHMFSFIYSPISIASVLSRLIQIVGVGKQNRFDVTIENRGVSIVARIPIVKSTLVEILLDPVGELYYLSRLMESAGLSLIVDESEVRVVMPLQMPGQLALNIDYDALIGIVEHSSVSEFCMLE